MFKTFAAAAFAGVVALTYAAPSAAAQTRTPPPAPAPAPAQTDDTIKDRIDFKLETSSVVRKYDVKVKVAQGVATLSGDVATAAQKAEAGRLAHVPGVTKVQNDITVDPNED